MNNLSGINRRTVVKSALITSAAAATGALAASAPASAFASPALVTRRLALPSGVATGDVTSESAVLWARSSGTGRLHATLRALDADGSALRGRFARSIRLTSGWVTDATDGTAKIMAKDLPSNTRFEVTFSFEDENGNMGEVKKGSFTTAPGAGVGNGRSKGRAKGIPVETASQSFVWTADTAGQGYGINPEIGGMRGYGAMHAVKPDFFLHSGDTVYADGPISATMKEPNGDIWHNLVTEEVSKVAETLNEFRGRHRYNMMDENLRAMYAEVPVIAQWDDHETTNNWWAGEVLEDPRYTVRDVNTLAARGRRAWQEYMPIADTKALTRGTGFEPDRIYRKIERGAHLDIFALDMRTFKGENTDGLETHETDILGETQLQWLIKGLRQSKATWKVIGNDLPLGLIVPDGKGQESISNAENGKPLGRELQLARLLKAIKDYDIKNVVFLTGDVHYCAAHHYSPERAAFKDFKPFWEFVAGPINAGAFGPNKLDGTFGPKAVFEKAGPVMGSPRNGEWQFFGQVDVAGDGSTFTVKLVNANGDVQYTNVLPRER
ncbi:alkaline phosphatase D family protein [Neomicrococcus aestuarii]|uniref:Alkaline phosphatase n=1 Tax=Neomicrococcus aestuarii TaxID=556325 RepID=A0A1L2ZQ50_9MICC|nr:alkaline phosphatase D family protein [Neomicrococcus aestuarii]APF41316.1 alkaline phosphatase [Neomicrococcus aestuarii]MBB5513235.1 alkaline phosphatase D [Neomicrococcus aestuarii]